jgi:Fe-Mn family superoxide dismutase
MKNIEKKIEIINEQIKKVETDENKKLFINEMKKIGIEKLPYAYSALKQFIDAETMNYHYNKHYKGYVDKLNSALSKKKYGDLELEDIIKSISKFNKTIRNNAGGAFNHALFWKMLSPNTQEPNGDVLEKIKKDFKTYRNFKLKFEEIAKERFGSGWVWLILTKTNKLKIVSTPNQDNPLMNVIEGGGYPLLGLDLWEHAYYLKYRNKRDDYIKNFWKCVNWEFVNKLYNMKSETKINESVDLKNILSEGKSEKCSKEETEAIRFIFNANPIIKHTFKNAINRILREVFAENYFGNNDYKEGEIAGIYNLEKEGRSIINKLNTNYSCFCLLLNDVNKVLKHIGMEEIKIIGLPPKEQLIQTKKFIELIDYYKFRIFNPESSTFKNLMRVLTQTDKWGQIREDETIKILKKKFGKENVISVGKLGSDDDMNKGIDCKIIINGATITCQIKPFSSFKKIDNKLFIYDSANVKKYTTDWLIFTKNNKEVLIFKNYNTNIVGGNYVFPVDDLIYTLS